MKVCLNSGSVLTAAGGDGGAAVRDVVQGVPHRPGTVHARRRPRHHERRRLRVVAGKRGRARSGTPRDRYSLYL